MATTISEHVAVEKLRRGQKVVAGDDKEIGEVLEVVTRNNVSYLHVRRYGSGEDEMYVPTIAVYRAVGNHLYLHLDSFELVGEPWHRLPAAAYRSTAPPNGSREQRP